MKKSPSLHGIRLAEQTVFDWLSGVYDSVFRECIFIFMTLPGGVTVAQGTLVPFV